MIDPQPAPVRPRFVEGQFITEDELSTERAYRELAQRRHHVSSHTWGVVSGLRLDPDIGDDLIQVGSGLAIDGYGRTLTLDETTMLDLSSVTGSVYVWLVARASGPTDHVSVLRVGPAKPPVPAPPGRPRIGPLTASSTPQAGWPVILGRVDSVDSSLNLNQADRVSAGLVGEAVTSPSGTARLVVGSPPDDARQRFSIATVAVPTEDEKAAGDDEQLVERLAIDREGHTTFKADTAIGGRIGDDRTRVVVRPVGLLGRADPRGVRFGQTDPPAEAAPWTMYRTEVERSGRKVPQLRIELLPPGDGVDPRANAFVIGANDGTEFRRHLTVRADRTVTVHGMLHETGVRVEGPIRADFADPRFLAEATSNFLTGAIETSDALTAQFLALGVAIDPDTAVTNTTIAVGVEVTNVGLAAVTDLVVTLLATAEGTTTQLAVELDRTALDPSGAPATGTVQVDMPTTDGVEVELTVIAVAVGPDRRPAVGPRTVTVETESSA